MKVNIVSKEVQKNDKTGEVKHILKALCNVQSYGKVTLDLISIKVDNIDAFKLGETDLNIVIPKSEYPYNLA